MQEDAQPAPGRAPTPTAAAPAATPAGASDARAAGGGGAGGAGGGGEGAGSGAGKEGGTPPKAARGLDFTPEIVDKATPAKVDFAHLLKDQGYATDPETEEQVHFSISEQLLRRNVKHYLYHFGTYTDRDTAEFKNI